MEKKEFDINVKHELEKLKDIDPAIFNMKLFAEYAICDECLNEEAGDICLKCGYCGREFGGEGECININEYPGIVPLDE